MARERKKGIRDRANDAADKIESAGRSTIEAVHECGLLLLEVKHASPHGEFLEWVEKEFKHGDRLARKYMQIGKCDLRSVMDCNTIAEAIRISSPKTPEKAANSESISATVADLTPDKAPARPETADDFADLEVIGRETVPMKPPAIDLEPINDAAQFLMGIPNIGVAAKCLLEALNEQTEDRQRMFREIWNLVEDAA